MLVRSLLLRSRDYGHSTADRSALVPEPTGVPLSTFGRGTSDMMQTVCPDDRHFVLHGELVPKLCTPFDQPPVQQGAKVSIAANFERVRWNVV